MTLGLVSDTHGRLRAELFNLFDGVDRILHAGDIGPAGLLVELEALAPVTAVWGNTDGFEIRERVPERAEITVGDYRIVVVHGHQLGSPTPAGLRGLAPTADIIVYGHTHRPLVDDADTAALVVNPGSAGAPRFGIPASVALLRLDGDPAVELIDLD